MRNHKGPQLYLRDAKRPGGQRRWVVLDRDANGRRREISTGAAGDDRAAAEKFFAAHLAAKHVPNFGKGSPDQVLIADVLAWYGEHRASEATRQDNVALSLLMLGRFFSGKTADEITPKLCDSYVEWRIRQGDARKHARDKTRLLKPATARCDLTVLKAAINFCYRERKLAVAVPVKLPESSEPRPRCLSVSEAARLLRAALGWDQNGRRHPKRINRHLARFILIGLYSGTRHDRILRLQWIQNLQGGWIDLERGILHRRADNELETKKRAPSVPMGNRLLAHMQRWRKLSARYVIEHSRGNVEHSIGRAFAETCKLAGLSVERDDPNKVVPHTLRHTCASWLLDQGKSPWQVGQYLGMTAQMVERTYGHPNEEGQRETANAMRPSHSRPTDTRKRA